jgi:Tol biopolymer transport system component
LRIWLGTVAHGRAGPREDRMSIDARTAWAVSGALAALAAFAQAAPEQITASAGDSRVDRFAPGRSGLGAVVSDGDLTPGAPGNTDGSREAYFVDFDKGRVTQVTSSDRNSGALRVTEDGDVVVASTGDLTPGDPGNADRSWETWFWTRSSGRLQQLTATSEDTFFQAYYREGRRAFFVSKGDLTPGDPGNAERRNEVFSYHLGNDDFRQLTSTPEESLTRAIDPKGRFALIQSRGDLTPGAPGNADGSWELFLLDLQTLEVEQRTSSAGDSIYAGWSDNGRYVAFTSTGDLVAGGNGDGSREVFVLDVNKGGVRQITASGGDSDFADFGPRSHRVGVHSRADLLPEGDGDGSQEVFVRNLRNDRMKQLTRSDGDSWLLGFAPKGRWSAIVSIGDLTPGAPGNADGSEELYLVKVGRKSRTTVQATDGDAYVGYAGFDKKARFVGVTSRGDLVPGRNTDGSSEAYLVRVRRKAGVVQLTESDADSSVGGFLPDGKRLVLHSRADLDPSGPGNADGSQEVFVDALPR